MPATNTAPLVPPAVPLLRAGDRLDAVEYLRRYEATDESVTAELIQGVVVMASPVRSAHGFPDILLSTWLGTYSFSTPATRSSGEMTVELDGQSVPQPDMMMAYTPPRPVQARIGPRGWFVGCPDLVIEIANTTARIDLGPKRAMYERAGAREYLVWQPPRGVTTWLTRDGDRLVPLAADAGMVRSLAFPGLWLDTAALRTDDGPALMAGLRDGLASPEYAAFAAAGRA